MMLYDYDYDYDCGFDFDYDYDDDYDCGFAYDCGFEQQRLRYGRGLERMFTATAVLFFHHDQAAQAMDS